MKNMENRDNQEKQRGSNECIVILEQEESSTAGSPEIRKVHDMRGSSVYVVIPKDFAEECGIKAGGFVKISKATGYRLVMEKVDV